MKTAQIARIISSTSIFRGVSERRIEEILNERYFPISRYEEGKCVAFRGEPYEELCVILKGALQAEIHDIEGHTLTVETLSAPQIVASAVFFSSERRLPVSLVAKSAVTLMRIPRRAVHALLKENDSILEGLLSDMGDRLQFLAQRLRMNQFGSIRQKIAVYLLDLVARHGRAVVRIPHSRQELADIFGVARPSVSRVLSELEHEGILHTKGHEVEVAEIDVLRELAQDVGVENN